MMRTVRFRDRTEAGQLLAEAVAKKEFIDPVVLALPRGGVPVALEVARRLGTPLDLCLVRKIGVPFQPELAAGAVVDGGDAETIYNHAVMRAAGLTREAVDHLAEDELVEIERRRTRYLSGRGRLTVTDKTAIIVDDGLATGATARAAIRALRRRAPRRVVLAVPVAPAETLEELASDVDETICLACPEYFYAIGAHYDDFRQVSDEQVIALLAEADELVRDVDEQ